MLLAFFMKVEPQSYAPKQKLRTQFKVMPQSKVTLLNQCYVPQPKAMPRLKLHP